MASSLKLKKQTFRTIAPAFRSFGKLQPKVQIEQSDLQKFGTFRADDIQIKTRTIPKPKPDDPRDYRFGKVSTDHMFTVDWSHEGGWEAPQIQPYGPMSVPISATSLHYGLSCYEGLNIVKNRQTGMAQGFRADDHMSQFLETSNHLDFPLFDHNELLKSIGKLVEMDKDWFPSFPESNDQGQLYLRLLNISTDPVMGVKTANNSRIIGVLNPCTLKERSLSVRCSDGTTNKNWPLGHGQYTLCGNLGPLVPAVSDAKANGFDDILWLLDDYVQEMSILNVFFLWRNRYGVLEMVTPNANGCILPGTIRNTILDLKDKIAEDHGIQVVERPISIHEIINAHAEDRLIEMIGTSTPSFIQPINRIVYKENSIELDTNENSKYVHYLNSMISNIMTGPDTNKWITKME